ncbi:MAG: hypothetical protein ACR2PI_21985 [Hyphomicrobiaceae bacterium]
MGLNETLPNGWLGLLVVWPIASSDTVEPLLATGNMRLKVLWKVEGIKK